MTQGEDISAMKERDVSWDEEIAGWKNSGLSQAEYCRRRGIGPKGFAYRLMKSRADASTDKSKRRVFRNQGRKRAGFIEITQEEPKRSEYSIRTKGGRELVVRGSIEARELKALLEVLESC